MANSTSFAELLGKLGELKGLLDQAHARETASWEAELRDARCTKSEAVAPPAQADAGAWLLPNAPEDPEVCTAAAVRVEAAGAAGNDRSSEIEILQSREAATPQDQQTTTSPATERPPSRKAEAAVPGLFPKSLKQVVQMQIELKNAGAFEVRSAWHMNDNEMEKVRQRANQRNQPGKFHVQKRTSRGDRRSTGVSETEQSRCVMRPASGLRLAWDVCACLLLSVDLVLVPLSAFHLGRGTFLAFMEWLSVVFWALDIGASFTTGIYVGRELELRSAKIARAYMRSWFGFDVVVVVSEFVMVVLEAAATTTSLARTLRTARFLRVVRYLRIMRLLRLVRFKHVIDDLKDSVNHEFLLMAISVSKLAGLIGFLVHALACAWYFIGDVPPEEDGGAIGWVWIPNEDTSIRLADNDLGERYLYSFQFSLARLHPSNMSQNMELQTIRERFFSLFATVVAMFVVSILVSHLTNRMAEVKNMRSQLSQKSTLIRHYVQKHPLSTPLIAQLKKYIVTVYAAKLREGDEKKLMEVLPQYLLADLRHETFSPAIEKHRLFSTLSTKHKRTMIDICFRALQEEHVYNGETLFTTGDVCTRMRFVVTRPLYYELGYIDNSASNTMNLNDAGTEQDDECIVEPEEWISEAALWTAWENCGELRAMEMCSLFSVDADNFSETMREHTAARVDVIPYARQFVQDLNNNKDQLTDLMRLDRARTSVASVVP